MKQIMNSWFLKFQIKEKQIYKDRMRNINREEDEAEVALLERKVGA